jgi:SHS2 domain-containing protein
MGFEEVQHAADWALRVWSDDLAGLFSEAARGMNSRAGVQLAGDKRVKRRFKAQALDAESLLVAFLSELIYFMEHERLAFDRFEFQIENQKLSVELTGAALESLEKPIKAVTYHNLKIGRTGRGYEVEIVFDV